MATTAKKTIRAMTARWVTWLPQVGPTVSWDTVFVVTLASLARASVTLACSALRWFGVRLFRSAWTSICCRLPLPRTSTVGWLSPAASTAVTALAWVTPGASTVHDVPPLNVIPRFRPRKPSENRPATMMTAEMANHHFRRPTKSNDVSPR